jgi:hypothetical protein
MPTAEELREISRHKNAVEIFLDIAVSEVKSAANHGETHVMVEVPPSVKPREAIAGLHRTFPGCTIRKNWFSPHIRVQWD